MRAKRADLQRRNRQLEIIDWAGGRGEMENVIEFVFRQKNVARDVVFDEPVILVPREVPDVFEISGDQIVDRDDAMALRQEPIGQMRPEEARAARDYRNRLRIGSHVPVLLIRHPKVGEDEVSWPHRCPWENFSWYRC